MDSFGRLWTCKTGSVSERLIRTPTDVCRRGNHAQYLNFQLGTSLDVCGHAKLVECLTTDPFGRLWMCLAFKKVKKCILLQTELANISYFIQKIASDSSNQHIDFSKLSPTTALQVEVGEINQKTSNDAVIFCACSVS